MNINFKQIEAFVWVADLGSFRHAAERLNTTQPNISTRISNLEEMIGAKVMERDAGSKAGSYLKKQDTSSVQLKNLSTLPAIHT